MNFKKTLLGMVLTGAMALGMAGCEKGIQQGRIYDKEYHPSSMTMIMQPMIIGEVIALMPMMTSHPERYVVKIEAEVNGKKQTNYFSVSKDIYETKQVGDNYP